MSSKQVALYGLGNMGYLIAERLTAHFPLRVADLNTETVNKARTSLGVQSVDSPADVADVDVVVLCLPSPAASQSVLRSIAPHLPKTAVVVETSTVNPSDIHAEAALLAPYDIPLIDASVMAGVSQMAAGTAMLLVGGEDAAYAACEDVLNAIAAKCIRFGPSGAGAAAKVINNAVAHAVMVVVAEAGSLATAAGVDCSKLVALLSDPQMGLHRPLTHRYAERVMQGNYAGGMPLEAARKDSVLALELAQSLGVPLFAIQGSHSVYEMAQRAGYGRDDYAAIAKLWSDWGRPAVPEN